MLYLKHRVTKDPLWSYGCYNSSWGGDQLRIRGLSQALVVETNESTKFVALLRACTKHKDLSKGVRIHDDIRRRGLLEACRDALVTMYAKCGALAEANELFVRCKSRDVFTWTALIAGYTQKGQGKDAIDLFEEMLCQGLCPDVVTYTCILKACGTIKAADKGARIHDEISKQGLLKNNIVLGNALITMYAKCNGLAKARKVLEELPLRNVVSWTTLIEGYAQNGEGQLALDCFRRMQSEGISPNPITYLSILKACSSIGAADKGQEIHEEISKQGLLQNDIVIGNALIDMYVKCGALAVARQVLEVLPVRNVISWTALIVGYAEYGEGKQALKCFEWMKQEGLSPNEATYLCILKACANTEALEKGERIHEEISKQGLLGSDIKLGTALVDMYAKCGALTKAWQVLEELPFHDVTCWTALIAGFAEHGEGENSLNCYEQMQREGLSPNTATFLCILKACGSIGSAEKAEKVHDDITKQGLLATDSSLGNALVDMYAKCGALAKARQVLEELPVRDVISWTAIICGYVEQEEGEEAFNCLDRMLQDGLSPNAVTFVCLLKACGGIGAADKGERIHDESGKWKLLKNNMELGNALVDMYAKCGALAKARQVLEELPERNAISWTTLMAAYKERGENRCVLDCFERMQHEGHSPDAATFSCVLTACSHLGLVEDAQMHLMNMSIKYGMEPGLEHYTSMVDMLGRAGHLDRAARVLDKMPPSTNVVWSALLGACQKWDDVEVGRWAFEHALQADKNDPSLFVHLANICAAQKRLQR